MGGGSRAKGDECLNASKDHNGCEPELVLIEGKLTFDIHARDESI